MSGLYLHIPFCKSRCNYCDFYSDTDESQIDRFVECLCVEVKRLIKKQAITTLYFGGGTPSRLRQAHFEKIFATLFNEFSIAPNAEITLEANPDDLSPDYIRMLSAFPINRLSIGIQSFNDKELQFLNRRHSAQQAIKAVKNVQNAGFHNISIDLMYGLPYQSIDDWQKNLQQALALQIQHVSAYHLIYEEDTKMYSLLQSGKINPLDEQLSNEMFSILVNTLTTNGFIHYEISNFALPTRFSQHNSSYWLGAPYIGLGAAAHSFDGDTRSWNVSSMRQYIEAIESKAPYQTVERLSVADKYNEFILTGLRTMWGVDLEKLRDAFGKTLFAFCMQNAQRYIDNQLLEMKNNTLVLSREGIFISDGIISDLMFVELENADDTDSTDFR